MTGCVEEESVQVGGKKMRYVEPSGAISGSDTLPTNMPAGGLTCAIAARPKRAAIIASAGELGAAGAWLQAKAFLGLFQTRLLSAAACFPIA